MKRIDADRERRLAWFREARFGMFIHWGLYAVPGGVWKGRDIGGVGEWIYNSAQITVADYEPLQQQFNPVKFSAKEWVATAKDAGMRYMVITSKHHDGFCLWDSKLTDWDVMGTPFKRDILKELAVECQKQKIKLCFYHSIMDWHHPDYLPRRGWDKRPVAEANFNRYIEYMKGQLKELLTGYGPIGIAWFDGEWEGTWTHDKGVDLYKFVRSLQPSIIVNNRVDKGRQGMAGMTKGDFAGDYGTPEQEIPANGFGEGVDWESCMTLNDTWGFKSKDTNWKSTETLLKNLIDCASKGGNYLLNVGPTPEGTFPQPIIERLAMMGKWLKAHGEALYGTQASPFSKPLPWGRVTRKDNKLYLHVFNTSQPTILLPGLKTKVKSARTLGKERISVPASASPEGITLTLPESLKNQLLPVIVLELDGPPRVEATLPTPGPDGVITLLASDAKIEGSTARFESDKNCIGFWTDAKDTVSWDFRVTSSGRFMPEVELACPDSAAGARFTLEFATRGKVITWWCTVPTTGSWEKFQRAGNPMPTDPSLSQLLAGTYRLTVIPKTKPGDGVMNLRAVRLKPV
ncbi:alpha-L-fucosidase [Armatimonas sp.]|uniref:alpha-L-fucosidase n=1 Tax=Armatimonas sp. TaxID=1872638 RepID=UPI00374CDC97